MSLFKFSRGQQVRLLKETQSDFGFGPPLGIGTVGTVIETWHDEDSRPMYSVKFSFRIGGNPPPDFAIAGYVESIPEMNLGYETPLDDLVNGLMDEL